MNITNNEKKQKKELIMDKNCRRKEATIRQSNFELMRIVSAIMILLYHTLSPYTDFAVGFPKILLIILVMLFIVHVNSFVLLCGYFQYDKKIRVNKFFKIINQVWFYKALIPVVFVLIGLYSCTPAIMIHHFLPFEYGNYWFVSVYLVLLAISPVLNIIIRNVDKKTHLKIIILFLIVFSFLPTLTGQASFDNERGFSISNFILLYFIGAYFGKYSIDSNVIFSKIKNNARQLIFFSGWFFFTILVGLIYILGIQLSGLNEIIEIFANILIKAYGAYDNPFIILGTVCYFLFFSTLKIRSKFINRIATCSFAVYIIHWNEPLREFIYKLLGSKNPKTIVTIMLLLKTVVITFGIFVCCIFIELIRQYIFKFIYKRKTSKKIRDKFHNYIESLGFSVNW